MRIASFEARLLLTLLTESNRTVSDQLLSHVAAEMLKSIGHISACQFTKDCYYLGQCSCQELTFFNIDDILWHHRNDVIHTSIVHISDTHLAGVVIGNELVALLFAQFSRSPSE